MGKKRIGNFRSNIFGGFNRRDVIGYIEQLHKNLNDLQKENELLHSKLSADEPMDKDDIKSHDNLLVPDLEESGLKREQDDSAFTLESESNPSSGEPAEPTLSDNAAKHEKKTASLNQITPVPNKPEPKTGTVSATRKTINVRKKTKK